MSVKFHIMIITSYKMVAGYRFTWSTWSVDQIAATKWWNVSRSLE